MDLASVVAALASVGVRVSGSAPNSSVQVDSSRACPPGLAGPEPSGTIHDLGQHFHSSCSVGGGVDSSNHQFPRHTFPIRLRLRLRVGRLTLGLTVADRWECSQATGLPAWRHQDLHITANRAHGITGTQTEESVLRYWSKLDPM